MYNSVSLWLAQANPNCWESTPLGGLSKNLIEIGNRLGAIEAMLWYGLKWRELLRKVSA